MEKKLVIGLLVSVSGRWPRELPQQRLAKYSEGLQKAFPDCVFSLPEGLVASPADVENAADRFIRDGVDLMIMVYGAFTGDDVPTRLCDRVNVPIILWAPHEPPFEREERLYSNALVALTMNVASLRRLNQTCYPLYGDFGEDVVMAELTHLVRAYQARKVMRRTLLGLFGYRVTGFYNSAFDEALIRSTFGVRIEETDLKVVFDEMAALDKAAVDADMALVAQTYDTAQALPEGHLENHSRLHLALQNVMARQGYDYAVIKCWPEMGALHTTPCAVLGRLADKGLNIGCESDVDAELAQIAQHALTNQPSFITDMINIDEKQNTLTFWHCGNAAPSLHDQDSIPEIRNHPLAGQGTAFWTALKPGQVTVARFYNFHGRYRLFILKGEAVKQDRYTRGAMVNVKVEKPVREVIAEIMRQEIPHHYCVVWADVAREMRELAHILGIEVIEI